MTGLLTTGNGLHEGPPFVLEVDYCSACGRNPPNADYVLYEKGVGACVADGIGGAPMGDAIARYACHVAMNILHEGGSALDAVEGAGVHVAQFTTTVNSPGSGASLVVAKLDGSTLEASWAGDAAIFVLPCGDDGAPFLSSLDCGRAQAKKPLCGASPASPGRALHSLAGGEAVIMCTDGVWRSADWRAIDRLLLRDTSSREVAARLVLGSRSEDDSTALVARIRRCS